MVDIFCGDCGAQGSVNRVTASLQCRCGSTDLGLLGEDGTPKQASGGSGWYQPRPDPLEGWSEYEGPTPGHNPLVGRPLDGMRPGDVGKNGEEVCPVCKGSGHFPAVVSGGGYDESVCRECNGTGTVHPTTGTPPVETDDATTSGPQTGGARWQGKGASFQSGQSLTFTVPATFTTTAGTSGTTNVTITGYRTNPDSVESYTNVKDYNRPNSAGEYPAYDSRSDKLKLGDGRDYSGDVGSLKLKNASCPECGNGSTEMTKDKNEDGWWSCPNCGPLANVDKHPDVNPYDHSTYAGRDKGFKAAAGIFSRNKQTGKLFKIMATIGKANDGLTDEEVFSLARKTVERFPERG